MADEDNDVQVKVPRRRFTVNNGIRSISHGEKQFDVKDGMVSLPGSADWYQYLIDDGTLVETDAPTKGK